MTALTYEAVAGYAYAAGFRGEPLAVITAISTPESGRDPSKVFVSAKTRDDSWGLWQINMTAEAGGPGRLKALGLTSKQQLLDPANNARGAYMISHGGSKFTDWTTFKNNKHLPYLTEARRAAQAVEARGGAPGGGATTTAATAAAAAPVVATEDFTGAVPSFGAGLVSNYDPSQFLQGYRVRGLAGSSTILATDLLSGTVQLSTDQVSEISLVIPVLGLGRGGFDQLESTFPIPTPVDRFDLHMVVAGRTYGASTGGLPGTTITLRSAGATALRNHVVGDAPTVEASWSGWSPTNVLQQLAGQAGLRFVGKGTLPRDTIVRQTDTTTKTPPESSYDMGIRLAKEEGFWFFEVAGVVYFAPPSWLVARMPQFAVDINQGVGAPSDQGGDQGCVGFPDLDETRSDDLTPGMPPLTVTVKLPRERGELVRPGMACQFLGVPSFESTYIVTDVSWSEDGGIDPATVKMCSPTDPVPDPPGGADDASDPADPDSTAATTTSTAPVAKSRSALDMTTVALRQVGDQYIYGAEASPTDPDPTAFDCSELVQWACSQVGVTFVDGSGAQIAAVDNARLGRTVAQAAKIRGAILWTEGHVAISLGDGKSTVEARGRAYGVTQATIGTRFTKGGLIPGLIYPAGS